MPQGQPSQQAIQRRMGQRGAQQSSQSPGQTTKLASRGGDPTSSDIARQGLLQAQAQKMQGGLPVGPEGTMPPSARGALLLRAQQAQQTPPSPSVPPMVPPQVQGMSQGGLPMQAPGPPGGLPEQVAAPAQDNMANQQNRFQEVLKRLQMAQQQNQNQPV